MNELSPRGNAPEAPTVQGHVMGFVNSAAACKMLLQALDREGIPILNILVMHGREGIETWDHISSVSDEKDAAIFRDGIAELEAGRFAVSVEVHDAQEAAAVAEISAQHGGHGFHHFYSAASDSHSAAD
jgi:hypothetical protein